MSPSEKARARTDVERWNDAVREAALAPAFAEDQDESDEEVERQLLEAGFDLGEIDALAAATYDQAVAKFGSAAAAPVAPAPTASANTDDEPAAWVAPSTPDVTSIAGGVKSPKSKKRSPLTWLAYAAAAAAATGGGVYLATRPPKEEPKKEEPPPVQAPDVPKATAPVESAAPPPAPPSSGSKGSKGPHGEK